MEDEEVYLRQGPSRREEGEESNHRASEQNPTTATVRHVRSQTIVHQSKTQRRQQ